MSGATIRTLPSARASKRVGAGKINSPPSARCAPKNVHSAHSVRAKRRGKVGAVGRVTERRPVTRYDAGQSVTRPDTLAVEEPLEIRVDGTPISVTMRTPGHDLDLALGFLLTEGIVAKPSDVAGAINCADNVVDVSLRTSLPDLSPTRNFFTSSSCGMCGKASIDAVRTTSAYDVSTDPLVVTAQVLTSLPDTLRAA